MRDYAAAVSEWTRMHSAHVAALQRGAEDLFHEQLLVAADRVDNAKYAIIAHQESHGC